MRTEIDEMERVIDRELDKLIERERDFEKFTLSNSAPATPMERIIVAGVALCVLLVVYWEWTGVRDVKDLFGAFFGYDGY